MPGLRFEAADLKFDREAPAARPLGFRDVRVDSRRERLQDRFRIRRVAPKFRLHVAAIAQPSRIQVACHRLRPEYLGESSLSRALPELHLKQPILGHDKALRKEKIVAVPGIDVRNTPAIPLNAHRLLQARNLGSSAYRCDG